MQFETKFSFYFYDLVICSFQQEETAPPISAKDKPAEKENKKQDEIILDDDDCRYIFEQGHYITPSFPQFFMKISFIIHPPPTHTFRVNNKRGKIFDHYIFKLFFIYVSLNRVGITNLSPPPLTKIKNLCILRILKTWFDLWGRGIVFSPFATYSIKN